MKAQALADFLVEGSFTEENLGGLEPKIPSWTLMVDGAINSSGIGVGIVLISLNQQHIEKRSINLQSTLSNNQAEYEALIIGMTWAHKANKTALSAYSDSQIVVTQVQGTYAIHSKSL